MKKEPSPESKEEEESTERIGSFGGGAKLEEEEPITPLPKQKKRMNTPVSDKKKPTSGFKTLVAPKQPSKTPQKGESSQKKQKKK